jgi:hypothetical protein
MDLKLENGNAMMARDFQVQVGEWEPWKLALKSFASAALAEDAVSQLN